MEIRWVAKCHWKWAIRVKSSQGTHNQKCNVYLFVWLTFFSFMQSATTILARQLVRLRQQIANLQNSRAQMRGIATHTQVHLQIFSYPVCFMSCSPISVSFLCLFSSFWQLQAMHANTAVAAGIQGANKAMGAMNKVMDYSIHQDHF